MSDQGVTKEEADALAAPTPGFCHLNHPLAKRSEVGSAGVLVMVEFCPVCEGNGTVQAEVPNA